MISPDRTLDLIKKRGWSIREFERRLKLSTGTVNGWITRKSIPAKKITYIARVLETSESYLQGKTDDPRLDEKIPTTHDGQPVGEAELLMARRLMNLPSKVKDQVIGLIDVLENQEMPQEP